MSEVLIPDIDAHRQRVQELEMKRLRQIEKNYEALLTLLNVAIVHEPFEDKTIIQISTTDMVASRSLREAAEKFYEWKEKQLLEGEQNV